MFVYNIYLNDRNRDRQDVKRNGGNFYVIFVRVNRCENVKFYSVNCKPQSETETRNFLLKDSMK